MEEFHYEILQTTPTKSLVRTIIKYQKQINKKIDYLAGKLAKTGMPLSFWFLSNDDKATK